VLSLSKIDPLIEAYEEKINYLEKQRMENEKENIKL